MKRVLLITGPPRTGKTTVLTKTVEELKRRGYKLGGMTSQEIREMGIRNGFEIRDISSGRVGWLAHVHQPVGPKIGKYKVNLDGLHSIGVAAILSATENAQIVVIDEIGPMELLSAEFQAAVQKAADSPKPILCTIHYRASNHLVRQLKSREDAEIIEVAQENRDRLPSLIVHKTTSLLEPLH